MPHPYLRRFHQLTIPWRSAIFFSYQDSQNLISDGGVAAKNPAVELLGVGRHCGRDAFL